MKHYTKVNNQMPFKKLNQHKPSNSMTMDRFSYQIFFLNWFVAKTIMNVKSDLCVFAIRENMHNSSSYCHLTCPECLVALTAMHAG